MEHTIKVIPIIGVSSGIDRSTAPAGYDNRIIIAAGSTVRGKARKDRPPLIPDENTHIAETRGELPHKYRLTYIRSRLSITGLTRNFIFYRHDI